MNDVQNNEDRLRAEVANLRQELEAQKRKHEEKKPSGWTGIIVLLLLAVLGAAGYYYGYLPQVTRQRTLADESSAQSVALPVVNVEIVTRALATSSLVLPGNIQAVTEAPVLARASGYIKKRYVDIGDRVKAGDTLADIEAPEIQQQILQASAAVEQANAASQQAQASLQQGESNENLAHITYDRFKKLSDRGVISRQEIDNYQGQWTSQQANVQALGKAVSASKSNIRAAEANVDRLKDMESYLTVKAPFAGVITVRNIDTGALVTEGNTLLFRVAQTGQLRTYVTLAQADAESVHAGQRAVLTIPDLPGRKFNGTVTRTAGSLDPATRTLLTEVQVPNQNGALMPGMYAQVDLAVPRKSPPLLIPSDTLVVRNNGPQVAVVAADGSVHFQVIQLGRDFGDKLEVLGGLNEGDQLAINPGDTVHEGAKVKPVSAKEKRQ